MELQRYPFTALNDGRYWIISCLLALAFSGLLCCSPKTCGDSSICQCHNKRHKHKVGAANALSYQEGEKKNKPDWYKKGEGLKKDRGEPTQPIGVSTSIVYSDEGKKKVHHKYKTKRRLTKDKSKRKKREKF